MKTKTAAVLTIAFASGLLAPAWAAKAVSDILAPERRRAVVESAQQIARRTALPPTGTEIPNPFNPAGFGKADKSEAKEGRGPGDTKAGTPAAPAAPSTDREILAAVASKIPASGTIVLGGKPLLTSGMNRIEVGSHFTVVYNGQEYELELVAITSTTFTVRYRGEDFTRPIKQGKSP
jgi:hypothetical protein